jgi:uncharacterized protein YeaO (DUF488 family)
VFVTVATLFDIAREYKKLIGCFKENFMKKTLRLSTFQIGTPRKRGQGLRIGTVRRPPRGVLKSRWVRDGYFDVWLPSVAPSLKLLHRFKHRDWDDPAVRKAFFDSYEHELLSSAAGRQTVEFVK